MNCYIRTASLNGYSELVRSYQVNPNDLLAQAGIVESQLREPNNFIQYDAYLKAIELAVTHCQDPLFGLRLGKSQSIKTLGIMGTYMARQSTLLDALNVAQKFIYLHADAIQLMIDTTSQNSCALTVRSTNTIYDLSTQKVLITLSTAYQIIKDLVGPTWRADKVCLRQPVVNFDVNEVEDFFGCRIEFNALQDSLCFQSHFLRLKPRLDESLINQWLYNEMTSQAPANAQTTNIERIEQTILALLPTGDCSKDNIAKCMGLHPKKLQRLLSVQGTSYRETLENVRKKEALKELGKRHVNVTMLALRLGYSELAIFSRTFKKWFGVSPSEWKDAI